MEQLDLIVLAAGRGTRTGLTLPKQFLLLRDRPVLVHSASVYASSSHVGEKFITVDAEDVDRVSNLLREYGLDDFQLVLGGATRQESVRNALQRVRTRRVLTHNAAVPFVSLAMIESVVQHDCPCVTTVTPFPYSLCRGDDFARETVDGRGLKLINSPQSFHTAIFLKCHEDAASEGLAFRTDCELLMHYGHEVRFVEGSGENFKITTPMDVMLAQAIAATRGPSAS
ncbi:MAG: 2-C-methyl-D-erythritol 4-phosphate cytidylyltransferase [Planctomycetales bacterium]|nr:2-C-methyl-D-erythritol 4-phosphate cytidylyltransferase [Planctomycetales bacterium]